MNKEIIELIHQQYEDYMKGYDLIGSFSVFIPFFKVTLSMKYICENELNIIEDFICRCIKRGVKEKDKITKVLAIDNDIFEWAINPLINNGLLEEIKNEEGEIEYCFTEQGIKLVDNKIKYEPQITKIDWYFDGLNCEYKVDFFGEEKKHKFLRYNEIEKNNLILTPKFIPNYNKDRDFHVLSKRVLSFVDRSEYEDIIEDNDLFIVKNYKKIVNIEDFELLQDREVFYHEYRILVYKNRELGYKLLAHDLCGTNYLDQRITETIYSYYKEGKFNELLIENDEDKLSVNDILDALENYAKDNIEIIGKEIVEKSLSTIEKMKENKIVTEYIMNYKIRELFLKYLKNAKKSLYIISPWMNNHIVNEEFKNDIINLLKRGVKIRIICGITDEINASSDIRDINTYKIANELIEITKPFGDLFKLKFGKTHEKLLICDEMYYINGSFNFLSYSGEDERFFRHEGSTYSEDKNLINETIKLRFNF